MARIDVDVDLSEFPLSEIVEYLSDKLKNKRVSNEDKELIRGIGCNAPSFPEITTLLNKQKMDFLLEHIDDISLDALEGLITIRNYRAQQAS